MILKMILIITSFFFLISQQNWWRQETKAFSIQTPWQGLIEAIIFAFL